MHATNMLTMCQNINIVVFMLKMLAVLKKSCQKHASRLLNNARKQCAKAIQQCAILQKHVNNFLKHACIEMNHARNMLTVFRNPCWKHGRNALKHASTVVNNVTCQQCAKTCGKSMLIKCQQSTKACQRHASSELNHAS